MRSKRGVVGPLNMLAGGAIVILIAIITISIGTQVNTNVRDSMRGDATAIVNEALANGTNSTDTFIQNYYDFTNGTATTNLTVYNPTANASAGPDEYKLLSTGQVNITNNTKAINASWINYSYYPHGADWNASEAGNTGLAGFSSYWVSIVSIIVLVVIIGLFAYFRGGSGGLDLR